MIDDLSRELLEVATGFKPKCKKEGSKLIKKIVKNVLPEYKKWLNNMWRKGNTYCLFCQKKTDNKKLRE